MIDRASGGNSRHASGYLVAPGLVLTAAHAVAGAQAVRVRLGVGQPTELELSAEGWWADPARSNSADLAVVMIPAEATAGRPVESARFGRISDSTAVLAVQALGFRGSSCARRSDRAKASSRYSRTWSRSAGHAAVAA